MHYVMDCSFSSALFLPDERSDIVREFFINLDKGDRVIVPLLWWYETDNVLNISVSRNRISHSDVITILDLLDGIAPETDAGHGRECSGKIFELTQLYKISAYDAVYLELAMRKKAALMTLDKDLEKAARKMGIAGK